MTTSDKAGADQGAVFDFHRPSNRRTFALMIVGAVVGLALAGFGLFTAKGTSTFVVPPEDVALVNQRPLNRGDFDAQLRAVYDVSPSEATPAQKHKVLDDMIREEVFVQRGQELDMASIDPDVRAALVLAVEQQVAADALTRQPTDDQLRTFYEGHKAKYESLGTMTVVDLVSAGKDPAAPQVQAAAQALRAGAAPAAVARFGFADSGKVKGEEFYFAAKIHLGEALFAVAQALPVGGVSAPVAASDGVHILVMRAKIEPKPTPFEGARDQVLADYRRDAVERVQKGDERFLKKRANILIAKDLR